MSKKKHAEHVNHERWLVSYADFITLLFAFFVVLFASGQNDKRKTVKLAQAMQSAFLYGGIFDQHSKTPPLNDDVSSAQAGTPAPFGLPLPNALQAQQSAEATTEKQIQEVVHNQAAMRQAGATSIEVHHSEDGLTISLREAGFFNSGSAEIRPEAREVLSAVAATLPHQAMRVEGHTDDMPIHNAQFATNWELSTARAADITRLLIAEQAVNAADISAAGYAEFHPIASNATEAGRQQNRRVDIILLKPKPAPTPAPAVPAAKPHPPAPSR